MSTAPPPVPSPARELLTARIVAFAAANGLAEISLRDLAAAVGTSHRMLNYHFGGRAGVVRAVVESVEADQRTLFAQLAFDAESPADVMRRQWALLSRPELRPAIALFVEVLALALRGHPGTEGYLDRVTKSWLDLLNEHASLSGFEAPARAEVLLGLAVTRGLLFEAAIAGSADDATAAFEHYIALAKAAAAARKPRPR